MVNRGENFYKRKAESQKECYPINRGRSRKYDHIYSKAHSKTKHKLVVKETIPPNQKHLSTVNDIKFVDLAEKWLLTAGINIKVSSFSRYRYIIDKYLAVFFKDYVISQINNDALERFVIYLKGPGFGRNADGLASKTIYDIVAVLKMIITYANKNGYTINCNTTHTKIKIKSTEMRMLSVIEENKLIAFLMNDIDLCKMGVLLSLYTGIRIGELCALKWKDINLTDRCIFINKTLQRIKIASDNSTEIMIDNPKSECSKRIIPIHVAIYNVLVKFKTDSESFLLTGKRDKYVEPRSMQYKFKGYIKHCGIDNANFHCLRHTFATRCIESGCDMKSLSEILGHSSVSITLNKYVHSSFELKTEGINKLDFPF